MEMMEKVAYLKGLAEGMDLDENTKEGKMFKAIIDLLDDVVLAISEMDEDFATMEEELDEVFEDLYGDELDDECDCDDKDAHRGCCFEGELYEVTCPGCSDSICLDEEMLDEGEIICPGCHKTLEFDLDGKLDDEEPEETRK